MRHSDIVASMQSAIARDTDRVGDARAITEVYRQLPLIDFSRHVLPGAKGLLRVMKVDRCGWSDIGTPARLLETLRGLPRDTRTDSVNSDIVPLNLSMQLEKRGHHPITTGMPESADQDIECAAAAADRSSGLQQRALPGKQPKLPESSD